MHRILSKLALATLAAPAYLYATAAAQGTTELVSIDSGGAQGNGDSPDWLGVSISADGRFVAFISIASNLVPGDSNGLRDVFVHDRVASTTERVSIDSGGAQGNGDTSQFSLSISANGRFVAFSSAASNLVPGDTNGCLDVFVRDRSAGTTERVSIDSGGAQGNGNSGDFDGLSISADGRFVAFSSDAANLVPGDSNGWRDVFVHDRVTGITERVSVTTAGAEANGRSYAPTISADGRFVAFASDAANLVLGDSNGWRDVFVHDRVAGTTERVSIDSSGAQGNNGSGDWVGISISADGRFVAFESDATNLVAGDTNGSRDVFIHDRQSGITEQASVDSVGIEGNNHSFRPSISADGRYVAFDALANNLVPGDANGYMDVFMHDRMTGLTNRVSVGLSGMEGNLDSFGPSISADGGSIAFASSATNVVSGDTNGAEDTFVVEGACTGAIAPYCTSKTNSLGCLPAIASSGLPSQSGPDNFYVTASNVRNNKFGMMLWSLTQDSHPFFGGTLCLHTPIKRTHGQSSGGSATGDDCTGAYSFHFTQGYMLQQLLGANTTVYAQFWSRDPGFAPPNNIGLTDGLQFTICP